MPQQGKRTKTFAAQYLVKQGKEMEEQQTSLYNIVIIQGHVDEYSVSCA